MSLGKRLLLKVARVIIETMTSMLDRVHRAGHRRLVGAAYVVALLGGVCIGLWVVGDVSDEPYNSPDGGSMLGLRLPAPLYGDGVGTVMTGLLGAALITAAVAMTYGSQARLTRTGVAWLWPTITWSALVGLAVGAALRVIFAITYFANMDGGVLLIVGLPVLTFAWIAGVIPLNRSLRVESKSAVRPAKTANDRIHVSTILLWAVAGALVIASPFNVATFIDGAYWASCKDSQCGDSAAVGQLVLGGLGTGAAVLAVIGAVLWRRHRRDPRSR